MRAIINVSLGGWYPRGTDRLLEKLDTLGCPPEAASRDFVFRDRLPPGCKSHHDNPYEFKVRALELARDAGVRAAIWVDSSVWFFKHPEPMFARVERDGYYFFTEGWSVGQWCTDEALPKLGLNRTDAFATDMVSAICYGLDLQSDVGTKIIAYLRARADDGSYLGAWRIPEVSSDIPVLMDRHGLTGEQAQVSRTPGVLGHRHDQTALSVVIAQLGLVMEKPPTLFMRKGPGDDWYPADTVIATASGNSEDRNP